MRRVGFPRLQAWPLRRSLRQGQALLKGPGRDRCTVPVGTHGEDCRRRCDGSVQMSGGTRERIALNCLVKTGR